MVDEAREPGSVQSIANQSGNENDPSVGTQEPAENLSGRALERLYDREMNEAVLVQFLREEIEVHAQKARDYRKDKFGNYGAELHEKGESRAAQLLETITKEGLRSLKESDRWQLSDKLTLVLKTREVQERPEAKRALLQFMYDNDIPKALPEEGVNMYSLDLIKDELAALNDTSRG